MDQLQRRMDEATRELCCGRLAVVRQGEGDAGWLESQMEATDSASRLLQLQSPRARGDATLSKLRQLSQAVKQRVNAVVLRGPRSDGRSQTPDLREDGCGAPSASIGKSRSERQKSATTTTTATVGVLERRGGHDGCRW